jgi:GntR family transcriptional regulator/MocR family aminotransferase
MDLEPLFPDRSSQEPLSHQLARRLRTAIETGALTASARLLPSRELAARLGIGRNTVTAAIDQLIAEGYLQARVGSGTFVASEVAPANSSVGVHSAYTAPASAQRFINLRELLDGFADHREGALRIGSPDLAEFPAAAWKRLMRRHLERLGEHLDYGAATGYRPLREAIAQHVRQFRGVSAQPHRVIVTEGTQGALTLACDVVASPGETVVIEDPCYHIAYAAIAARRLEIAPVNVDDQGIDVSLAPAAKLAYVAPSHHFPLGGAMSLSRRKALLDWALANDGYVLEDDYDSEYYFDARPLPALQSLDHWERVIYIGSFSKTLAPGLRLGYLIVPEHLVGAFTAARAVCSLGGSNHLQAPLADFLAEGHFARHVRRMTGIYDVRRKAMLGALAQGLDPSRFRVGPSQTGLHIAVLAPSDYDDVAATKRFSATGAGRALSTYCIRRTDCRGFRLGYAAAPVEEVLAATNEFLAGLSAE